VAGFRLESNCGQLSRHIRAATQSGKREIFLRVFANVANQTVQRVVRWIHRPDNFVEGTGCFACGLGNLLRMHLDFLRENLYLLSAISPTGHLRQVCAELVVKVAAMRDRSFSSASWRCSFCVETNRTTATTIPRKHRITTARNPPVCQN